jgi:hypothetical protein
MGAREKQVGVQGVHLSPLSTSAVPLTPGELILNPLNPLNQLILNPYQPSTCFSQTGASPGRRLRRAIRIRAAIVRPPSSHGNFSNGHLPISSTLFVTISSVDGHFATDDSARCTVLHLDAPIAVFLNPWTVRGDT